MDFWYKTDVLGSFAHVCLVPKIYFSYYFSNNLKYYNWNFRRHEVQLIYSQGRLHSFIWGGECIWLDTPPYPTPNFLENIFFFPNFLKIYNEKNSFFNWSNFLFIRQGNFWHGEFPTRLNFGWGPLHTPCRETAGHVYSLNINVSNTSSAINLHMRYNIFVLFVYCRLCIVL